MIPTHFRAFVFHLAACVPLAALPADGTLDEVVVTASLAETPLALIPASVTVLNADGTPPAPPPVVPAPVITTVLASYYGPGFYGNRTACGQTMSTTLQGVAHRTLPCGTPLSA